VDEYAGARRPPLSKIQTEQFALVNAQTHLNAAMRSRKQKEERLASKLKLKDQTDVQSVKLDQKAHEKEYQKDADRAIKKTTKMDNFRIKETALGSRNYRQLVKMKAEADLAVHDDFIATQQMKRTQGRLSAFSKQGIQMLGKIHDPSMQAMLKREKNKEQQESVKQQKVVASASQSESKAKAKAEAEAKAKAQPKAERKVEEKQAAPVKKEAKAEEKQAAPVKKETKAEEKQAAPVKKEAKAEEKQAAPVKKEVKAEEKQAAPVKKEVKAEEKQAAPVKEAKADSTTERKQTAPVKKEAKAEEKQAAPVKKEAKAEATDEAKINGATEVAQRSSQAPAAAKHSKTAGSTPRKSSSKQDAKTIKDKKRVISDMNAENKEEKIESTVDKLEKPAA